MKTLEENLRLQIKARPIEFRRAREIAQFTEIRFRLARKTDDERSPNRNAWNLSRTLSV